MSIPSPLRRCAPLALAVLLLSPVASAAQDEPEGLEEIVVTATRRGEVDIQTTPVAVTAISDSRIEALSPRDLGDIATLVPNFSAGKPAGFNAAAFAIRGVGQTSIIVYEDPQVGVTVDDFVVPHIQTQVLEMFDIEQVEVLRGPQGTLFGKNTTGGVINVRTKRPHFDGWEVDLRAKVASYGRYEERVAFNLPVNDTLALRVAGVHIRSDGYYKNGASYGPVTPWSPFTQMSVEHPNAGQTGQGDGRNLGGDNVFSGRAKALWTPNDDFSALLTYEMIRDDSDSPPIVNSTPQDDRLVFSRLGFTKQSGDPLDVAAITERDDALLSMSKGHRVDVDGIYLNLEWNVMGETTLYSVTGHRKQESRLPSTYTGVDGPLFDATPDDEQENFQKGSLFDATRDDDRETFQQELRLTTRLRDRLDLVAGAFYQRDKTTFCVLQVLGFLDLYGLGTANFMVDNYFNQNPQVLCNEQKASNWAAFADVTYAVSEHFSLAAGFRYTDEKKKWRGRHQVLTQLLGGAFNPALDWRALGSPLAAADFDRWPTGVVSHERSWEEPTFRVTASWNVSEDIFYYLTYARGFKSGAYNDQTGTAGNEITQQSAAPTDPELADSLELGVKFDLNDRVRLDLAAFYVVYEDAQRTLNSTFLNSQGAEFQETRFYNAAEMSAYGLEVELTALLPRDVELNANWGFLNTDYDSFEADTDFDGVTDIDLSERDVSRAPEMMGALDLSHTLQLWGGELRSTVGVSYESEAIFAYSNVTPEQDGLTDSRTLVNASLYYTRPDENWFIRFYGRNLGDDRYRIGELPVANLWIMTKYGAPRTYGVELGFNFGE